MMAQLKRALADRDLYSQEVVACHAHIASLARTLRTIRAHWAFHLLPSFVRQSVRSWVD